MGKVLSNPAALYRPEVMVNSVLVECGLHEYEGPIGGDDLKSLGLRFYGELQEEIVADIVNAGKDIPELYEKTTNRSVPFDFTINFPGGLDYPFRIIGVFKYDDSGRYDNGDWIPKLEIHRLDNDLRSGDIFWANINKTLRIVTGPSTTFSDRINIYIMNYPNRVPNDTPQHTGKLDMNLPVYFEMLLKERLKVRILETISDYHDDKYNDLLELARELVQEEFNTILKLQYDLIGDAIGHV